MDIKWNTNPTVKNGTGSATVNVSAGQTLKIETSPDGIEVVEIVCPDGKKWSLHISVFVEESNA